MVPGLPDAADNLHAISRHFIDHEPHHLEISVTA